MKYEFHLKTKHNITDLVKKIESAGYKVIVEAAKEGFELHIMNGNNGYMNVCVELYKKYDGWYVYEIKFDNQKDFMTLHDIIHNIEE
jgi:hypothetical protein